MTRTARIAATAIVASLAASVLPGAASAQTAPDPCVAARTPLAFTGMMRINPAQRALIQRYRAAWRSLCGRQGATLYQVFDLGKQVQLAMAKTFDRALQRAQGKAADRLHTEVQQVIPRFLPAFHGSVIEFEYFELNQQALRAKLALGDAKDKLYWSSYDKLFGGDFKAAPWIERTWDYGGCVKFGRYKWVAALKLVQRLRGELTDRPLYLQSVNQLPGWMARAMNGFRNKQQGAGKICTCDAIGAVNTDLIRLSEWTATQPAFANVFRATKPTLEGVLAGTVRVMSQKVKHCSGG